MVNAELRALLDADCPAPYKMHALMDCVPGHVDWYTSLALFDIDRCVELQHAYDEAALAAIGAGYTPGRWSPAREILYLPRKYHGFGIPQLVRRVIDISDGTAAEAARVIAEAEKGDGAEPRRRPTKRGSSRDGANATLEYGLAAEVATTRAVLSLALSGIPSVATALYVACGLIGWNLPTIAAGSTTRSILGEPPSMDEYDELCQGENGAAYDHALARAIALAASTLAKVECNLFYYPDEEGGPTTRIATRSATAGNNSITTEVSIDTVIGHIIKMGVESMMENVCALCMVPNTFLTPTTKPAVTDAYLYSPSAFPAHLWDLRARATLGHIDVGSLRHGPNNPLARCNYCGEVETIAHAFGCVRGHAAAIIRRHDAIGDELTKAVVKHSGTFTADDVYAEVALGSVGDVPSDARQLRIDRYFVDRTAKVVIPVEQKVSSNLPAVIADANRKYGPLLAKMGPPVTARRAHGGRFNLDTSYKWEPRLHIFALVGRGAG